MVSVGEFKIFELIQERIQKSIESLPCLVSIDTTNSPPPLICLMGKTLTEYCIVPLVGEDQFTKINQNQLAEMRLRGVFYNNIKFEVDMNSFSALKDIRTEKYGSLLINGSNIEIIVKEDQGIFDSRVIINENLDQLADFKAIFENWQITTESNNKKQILWTSTEYDTNNEENE